MNQTHFSTLISIFVDLSVLFFASNGYAQNDSVKYETRLNEVVVQGTIPRTKMKANSIETRIVGSILEHVGTADDVLSRIPGMVKIGDDLNVIGRGTPIYYVNGRKIEDADELKRIRSEQIRSIEVVNSPGAEYDATVNAVVKIKTVRTQGEGFGFDVNTSVNQSLIRCDTNLDFNSNLHYHHKGFDLFGTASIWQNYYYKYGDFGGGTYTKTMMHEQNGLLDVNMKMLGYKASIGANWQMNDHNTIGMMLQRFGNPYVSSSVVMDEDVVFNGKHIDHVFSNERMKRDLEDCTMLNIFYNGQLCKLTVDWNIDLLKRVVGERSDIDEIGLLNSYQLSTSTFTKNDMVASKLVFGKGSLKFGTEETYVQSLTQYSMFPSMTPNSRSSVKEITLALFAEYSLATAWGNWMAGVRYEHVNMNYHNYLNANENRVRRYDNVFPSLSWNRMFGKWNLSANYSIKTSRPNFWQMREATMYHSRYVMEAGNPLLRSTINQLLSLKAGYKWLIFGSEYVHANGKIQEWASTYNDSGTILLKTDNIAKPVQTLSLYATASPTFGFWSPVYTTGFTQQFLALDLQDDREVTGIRQKSFNKPMFLFYANNTFQMKKHDENPWRFELNLQYRSRMNHDNDEMCRDIWSLNAAIQKSCLNGNLTFRLSANDLLRHMQEQVRVDYGNFIIYQNNDRLSQSINFSVHYRFNASRSKYKGNGAGAEAKERIN